MSFRKLSQRQTPQQSRAPVSDAFKECHKKEGSMDTITGKLDQICLTEEMADVFFSFQGENIVRIPAHKMILALRSPVFKAMFYGSFPQSEGDIRIEDITLETFKRLVKYLYTDHLQLSKNCVIPLLYTAQKYQIAGLISKCENYLQDKLAVDNACTLFSHAKFFTMAKLRTNALKFIADDAIDVLKHDDFLLLLSEDLVDILQLDSLCVQEVDIVRAVLKWVDHKLTKSKNKIDGKSRRAVLLKDGILYTMAIPLLSLEEYTSVVIPSSILTDEEQLQIFKAITIPNNPSACGKFSVSPRKGGRVVEVLVNDIVYPGNNRSGDINDIMFSEYLTNLQPENLSVKANKRIKIKSVTLKPQFQQPGQNNCNFKVDIKTVTSVQNILPRRSNMFDFREVESSGTETDEGTLNVTFEGRACKLPIDKVISENEKLVLTIKPCIPFGYSDMWGTNQHVIPILPQKYQLINGMMYQHELSQQTTLYLALTGGNLVESFEVVEIC
ncbi:BTB/POZ domain-containing protein 6-B-like [Mytilus californianus]|uniref:BTB/POZ domain-containing protein 6-B-like n=1 Tax=Mytilus californianus TaxID=6549 RepID=UPI002245E652|nr:BTB/POZ domain-containing protein 6-B-like [Mytilus californianus]